METNNPTVLNPNITTLGNFDLRDGERSLLKQVSKRSYKIFDLLKLFITYKDKKLLPESIMEKLWPENDLQDPKNALRTQVYRLRKMLTKMGVMADGPAAGFCKLDFQSGFYIFTLSEDCTLDTEEFCELIQQGNELKDGNPRQAMNCYQKALKLYKGEYLAENLYSEWLIPIRNRYHRLYFKALLQHLELLKEEDNYQAIIENCEEGFQIDPYEEAVHIFYLEALLNLGQLKQATSQYKYITMKLNQELGVKPSPLLRQVYREIKRRGIQKNDMNFWEIIRDLKEDGVQETAFYCELEEFRAIYNLERRKSIRYPSTSFLGIVSPAKDEQLQPRELKNYIPKLKNTLLLCLRKGDVLTQWNEDSLMFIITATSEENLDLIAKRIKNSFKRVNLEADLALSIEFQPIGEKKTYF